MSYPRGTLNLVQIKQAIHGWAAAALGGTITEDHVIWRQQSAPLPSRPVVTLKIIDGPRPVGRNPNWANAAGKKFNLGMQHVMSVSVQVFGSSKDSSHDALQLGNDLNSSLTDPVLLDALRAAGVSVQKLGDLSNLTALEESEYESRSGFDVEFGLAQNIIVDPSTIETVNIAGSVDGKPVTTTAVTS